MRKALNVYQPHPGICGAPLAMCAPGCIEFHEPSATLDVVIKVELGQLHDIVLKIVVPRSGAANLVGSEIKGQSRRELLEMTEQQTQR